MVIISDSQQEASFRDLDTIVILENFTTRLQSRVIHSLIIDATIVHFSLHLLLIGVREGEVKAAVAVVRHHVHESVDSRLFCHVHILCIVFRSWRPHVNRELIHARVVNLRRQRSILLVKVVHITACSRYDAVSTTLAAYGHARRP